MNTTYTILYALLATIFCLTAFFEPYPFSWLVKILPMLVLINLTWFRASSKLFFVAVVFSTIGDVALALQAGKYFIYGLGAFLVSHLFFISSFYPMSTEYKKFVPPYIVFAVFVFYLLSPHLGDLFVPVFIYMLVLSSMAIASLLSKGTNIWMIIGGISFIISDSLIGINKFYYELPASHFLIMVTYYFAQFALVKGYLKAYYNKLI